MFRLSCLKHTLLVVHLILVLILVVSIITSFILHGINPTLFLLTIFDLNSVRECYCQMVNVFVIYIINHFAIGDTAERNFAEHARR